MSIQRLSDKNITKIARATGLPLLRVWGGTGYKGHGWYHAVTTDHRHVIVTKDGRWEPYDGMCASSCPDVPRRPA